MRRASRCWRRRGQALDRNRQCFSSECNGYLQAPGIEPDRVREGLFIKLQGNKEVSFTFHGLHRERILLAVDHRQPEVEYGTDLLAYDDGNTPARWAYAGLNA